MHLEISAVGMVSALNHHRAYGKVHFSWYTVGTLRQFLYHHAYKIFGESRHDASFRALSCLQSKNKKQVERSHLLQVYKYLCGATIQRRRPGNILISQAIATSRLRHLTHTRDIAHLRVPTLLQVGFNHQPHGGDAEWRALAFVGHDEIPAMNQAMLGIVHELADRFTHVVPLRR